MVEAVPQSVRSRMNEHGVSILQDLLVESYDRELQQQQFEEFFHPWFRNHGTAHVFVFRKNLSVTDIQIAELEQLLLRNTSRLDGGPTGRIHLRSTHEFERNFQAAVRVGRDPNRLRSAEKVIALFGGMLERTVVTDYYWGTATVMLPPTMSCDVAEIVAASGYIHSAGELVWVSKLDNADSTQLHNQIARHLSSSPVESGRQRLFCAFAHEDFREIDRELASELRFGLDDIKLWVDKFYLGTKRLAEVLADIRRNYPQLFVPGPSSFRYKTVLPQRAAGLLEASRAMWLIVDRRALLDKQLPQPSEDRFIICYDQTIASDNPLIIFDENKPAWRAQTTLPHSLAAAMINLAAPYLPPKARILDPFAGTGTTLFEAARLSEAEVFGQDIEPISPLLIADNREFFGLSANDLQKLIIELRALQGQVAEMGTKPIEQLSGTARKVLAPFVATGHARGDIPALQGKIVNDLKSYTFAERLAFYICLRATVRNAGGWARLEGNEVDEAWREFFSAESRSLLAQISRLVDVRARKQGVGSGRYTLQDGRYSLSTTVSCQDWKQLCERITTGIQDACEPLAKTYHLIIADPPYGFNTDENWPQLAALYIDWLRNSVVNLTSPGQLLICLPERSRIGREAPEFARAEFVYQLLDRICHEHDRMIIAPSEIRTARLGPYFGRYYWESERALRRTILHVHIQ